MEFAKRTFSEIASGANVPIHDLGKTGNIVIKDLYAHIICQDGTKLSVQASEHHYSEPRDNYGPYTKVEIGFPSAPPPKSWQKYCENWDDPTGSVYAYVPVELVQQYIDLHGGEMK